MSKLSRKCCSFRTTESKTEAKGHLFMSCSLRTDYQSSSLLPCIWPLQAANGVHLPRAELQCYLFSLPQMQEHRTEGLRTRKRDPAVWNASPFWLLFSCCSYGRVLKQKTHQHLLPCKLWHDCFSCDGSLSWLSAHCLCSCNCSCPKTKRRPGEMELWGGTTIKVGATKDAPRHFRVGSLVGLALHNTPLRT